MQRPFENLRLSQRVRDWATMTAACPVCGAAAGVRCTLAPSRERGVRSGVRNGRRRLHSERLDAAVLALPNPIRVKPRRTTGDQVRHAERKRPVVTKAAVSERSSTNADRRRRSPDAATAATVKRPKAA